MRNFAFLISVAFMLVLGGCSGGAVRSVSDHSPAYDHGTFVYLTSGRDTLVVVRGNPFNMDQKAFANAVTDAMQGQHWGPRTHFTVGPSETARTDIRVVMLFHGSETVLGDELCASPERFGSVKDGNGLHLTAAFCSGSLAWTEVYAWAGSVPGVNSPTFARLVAQTTRDLFPIVDDILDDDDRRRPFFH